MKRRLILLLLCALFVLVGCAKSPQTAEPPVSSEEEITAGPLSLEVLNVEFVKGERNTDDLLALKKALPPLLISALAEEGVTVSSVAVTFGANAESTAQALSSGSVHVGFLPSSVYCAHGGELLAVADRVINENASLIGLYLPYGDQNAQLLEKLTSVPWAKAFSQEDLKTAAWAIPANDEAAERYLSLLLEENYGLSLDALENLSYYSDLAERDAALKSANFVLLYGFDAVTNNFYATLENLSLEGETVAVSAAVEAVASKPFRAALQVALETLCENEAQQEVIALYSGGEYASYRPIDDSAYDTQRYVLGYTEE